MLKQSATPRVGERVERIESRRAAADLEKFQARREMDCHPIKKGSSHNRSVTRDAKRGQVQLGKRVIQSFVPEPHASGHPGGVGNDLHIGR